MQDLLQAIPVLLTSGWLFTKARVITTRAGKLESANAIYRIVWQTHLIIDRIGFAGTHIAGGHTPPQRSGPLHGMPAELN